MKKINLNLSLKSIGIKPSDIFIIHMDAGAVAQFNYKKSIVNLKKFSNELINYIGKEGTIIVPTFSYSFIQNKIYNLKKTPSEVGQFSEYFRRKKNIKRSEHPIFSVAVYGKFSKVFLSKNLNDCFGENTIFDELKKRNAKIVCFGCSLDRITFVHHVEQFNGVKYRYFKNFEGHIVNNRIKKFIRTRYFVRKLNIPSKTNLKKFERVCKRDKVLKEGTFGRFAIKSIKTKDFFKIASNLLKKNPYSLIEKGN